jgi:hypothetical protein
VHALISLSGKEICAYKRAIIAPPTFQGLSACKVDPVTLAISTSFKGMISVKNKIQKCGFDKYLKIRESSQQNKRPCISPLRYRYDLRPWQVLESSSAVALNSSITR